MEKMEHVFYAQYDFNPFSQTWSCKEFEKVTKSQKIEPLPILNDMTIFCAQRMNICFKWKNV